MFSRKVTKIGICSSTVTPVIRRMVSVSTSRSVTTVPSDLANETLSYFANTPQRLTSPIRGTIRLAAYETKWHSRSHFSWEKHPTVPASAATAIRGTPGQALQTRERRASTTSSCHAAIPRRLRRNQSRDKPNIE